MSDFISSFFHYASATHDVRSPELFRKWSAIALCAGALERRVWVQTGDIVTFCNLYTLLVAPPGTGKQIIETVREFWTLAGGKNPVFKVAPDSMTKASLIDTLTKSRTTRITLSGDTKTYHSLLIAAEEFGVLLPAYDMEYVSTLNSLYVNKVLHEEVRRYGTKQEVRLEHPQLNILGGIQPAFMASIFPDEIWSTGLARRVIMIYSAERKLRDPFLRIENPIDLRDKLVRDLETFAALQGPIYWDPDAAEVLRQWILGGEKPMPEHSKLTGYNTNRAQNVMKLAGISAMSRQAGELGKIQGRKEPKPIGLLDAQRAIEWLLEAETYMPEIFRAMVGKSDWQIIEEMFNYVVTTYMRSGKQPYSGAVMYRFIAERAPSDKVARIIELAQRAHVIACVDQTKDLWKPLSKVMHVPE